MLLSIPLTLGKRGNKAIGPQMRSQLLCFSAGKKVQLRLFVPSQACLGLYPGSAQVVETEPWSPAARSFCSQHTCWGSLRPTEKLKQASCAYAVRSGPMWHPVDLRDSHLFNNSVKSTCCALSLPRSPVECCQGKGKVWSRGKRSTKYPPERMKRGWPDWRPCQTASMDYQTISQSGF